MHEGARLHNEDHGHSQWALSFEDRLHTQTWKETGETKTASFHYPEPFFLHFKYRHVVDDHNNLCHAVPSIEETWITTRWVLRVFQFLLAVTEVNMYLAFRFFVWDGNERMTLLEFRRMFAWEMINNPELVEAEEKLRCSKRCRNVAVEHCMQTAPKHARQWTGTKWLRGAKKAYQQYTCWVRDAPPNFARIVYVTPTCGCASIIGRSTMERCCWRNNRSGLNNPFDFYVIS